MQIVPLRYIGVREMVLPHLQSPTFDGSWDGAMFMTEIRGGSDLSTSDTVATQDGERWLLKTPHHLLRMDILLRVFPGVQVIAT